MKRKFTLLSALFAFLFTAADLAAQGTVPELIYYKFDQTGTTVTNEASSPPAGAATGTFVGSQTQGGSGLCGGALIGTGTSGHYVNTGWNGVLGNNPWTISFWVDAIPNNTTLYYQFGDPGSSIRCFNNGAAGAGNFLLSGTSITSVQCTGCAPSGTPSMSTFVYDPTLGNIKAYHDGVLVNTVAQGTLNINGTGFRVGGYNAVGIGPSQQMDEFRVYNRALDPNEVYLTYNACLPLVQLNDDAGITGFINPVIPTCSFNDTVSVTLKNYGTDTLTSASINWSKNNVNLIPIFWTGSLAPQASQTVFVGTTPYASGDNLCAWTTNPNGVVENPAGSYNDSSCIYGLSTGLSGTYTIGGVTPDYPDIVSAVTALNTAGVCGPTIFNIRSGTYFDQFSLGQISTMNATNTVTFRSEDGHRDSVTFDFASTTAANNYVVSMNNADYFRFEHMTLRNSGATYGRVFDISGGSDYNMFNDCALITTSISSLGSPVYSGTSNDNYNTFEGNTIQGGYYGAYWNGTSTSSLEIGNVFTDNEFLDSYYYGIRVAYQDGVTATHNRVYGVSASATRYGMYIYYCDKGSVITHNSIESNATSHFVYPFYLYYCDANATARGLVANNSITSGNSSYTGTNYGMYIYYSGFFDIYNNSVSVINGGTSSRALYLYQGGANNLKNNTFTNFGSGYAAYVVGTYAINEMDYNNLYTNGTSLAYYDVANTNTMLDWQTASGYDANSLNVNPGFYSDFDLHVCSDSLNNMGTPLALITDDMDNQPRNASTPDIGADEFAPLTVQGFLGPDALVCTGQTVSFTAGAPADDVLWSTNDTTNVLVVSMPGTYTVSVIGTCGISFDTVVVTASALTYSGFLMADTMQFCSGGSALLTSTMAANTYAWTGGSTNDSLSVTTGGTYTLNITDACGTGSESVVINELTSPTATFTNTSIFLTAVLTNTTGASGSATYAWNFGDGNSSTLMNPIHPYALPGTYWVTLTVTNECGSSTIGDSITVSTVGLEEIAGLGTIAVYPNPSNGEVNVDFNTPNSVDVSIQVTNVLGQTVYAKNIGDVNGLHSAPIDITNQAPGVYYVIISSNNQKVLTSKLVKQ